MPYSLKLSPIYLSLRCHDKFPSFFLLLALVGGVAAVLDVLPAEEMGFLEKNRPGISMMFGVIIASGVVKFLR